MLKFGKFEYSGNVISADDERLQLAIHSADRFEDIAQSFTGISEIIETVNGSETVYKVTAPLSAKTVSPTVHFVEFSTKLTPVQEMERAIAVQNEAIQELSDTIDQLLVDSLEG